MAQDFIKELGYLGLSTRLKRVSDNLMQEGKRLYQDLNMDIEPNWYLIFKLLKKHQKLSVTEIAQHLQLAHPSIITIISKMEDKGYLISEKSSADSRKRVLKLSEKAIKGLPEFEKVWKAGTKGMEEAFKTTGLLQVLEELETILAEEHFHSRTLTQLKANTDHHVKIIDYNPKYANDFAEINFQWLEKYFYIEDYDREVLTHPEQYILKPGGHILFAQLQGKIVGTVALIVRENGSFELSKMGVIEGYQGLKIGQQLMDAALDYSRKVGVDRVWLDSNRKLNPAINLYLKNGFKEIDVDPNTPYERCNIRMEKFLN